MEKKSKIILFSFFVIVIVVFSWSFYKFVIVQDYYIQTEIDCDPEQENCFIYECNLEEDEGCPEAIEDRISYYKLIQKKAYNMPICKSEDEDCPVVECELGEDCDIIPCDPIEEGGGVCSEE